MTTKVKIVPFREVKNGELKVNFHPGQTRVMESRKRFVAMIAGTQSGKTACGPHWLWREMVERGEGDYLAVTATFPLLRLKMLPELQLVFSTLLRVMEWKASDKVFESHERVRGGPAYRIIVGSAANPESLESATAKAAWCDEAGQSQWKREAWDAVLRRLSLSQGRVLVTTTPYELGWFKTEVYDRWQQGAPDIEVVQVDSTVNPAFPEAEYRRAMETMPRWKFNMFYRGVFERPAGVIYDAFDEAVCVIPRFVLPLSWPRYVGHDFGPQNTAGLWLAQDPQTGYLYAYREYLEGGLSMYDHAQKWKAMSRGETVVKRVGGSNTEDGWRESATAAGWPISKPRESEVEVGINIVYGWHQQNKLFVFNDLKRYLDEKLTYSRKLDDDYQPTEQIDNKSRFHLMDSERYILSDFGPERVPGQRGLRIQTFGRLKEREGFLSQRQASKHRRSTAAHGERGRTAVRAGLARRA